MTAPRRPSGGRLELWLRLFLACAAATSAEAIVAALRPSGLSWGLGLLGAAAFLPAAWIASGIGTALVLGVRTSLRHLRQAGILGATRLELPESLAAALLVGPVALLSTWWVVSAGASAFRNPDLGALLVAIGALGLSVAAVVAWALLALLGRAVRTRDGGPGVAAALSTPGALLTLCLIVIAARGQELGLGLLEPRLFVAPLVGLVAAPVILWLRHGRALKKGAFLLVSGAALLSSGVATRSLSGDLWVLSHRGPWSRLVLGRLVHDPGLPGVRSVSRAAVAAPPRPCQKEAPSFGANLVLVTIETLRADHTSLLGYDRPTTPHLEALAPESVVLERMLAQAPGTRLSLSALLSGTLPSKIPWIPQAAAKQMRRIGEETPWLPSLLLSHGYRTLAALVNFRAFTDLENAGFDRGFSRYDVSTELAYRGGTMRGFPGSAQVKRALELIDAGAGRPFFLWVHLVEPHFLYEQPPEAPVFGSDEVALYDAEIWEADRQLGRLVDGLRQRGLFDRTLLLVTGDHGEEFGEHGARWHNTNLYQPQLHTATLLRIPGFRGRRVQELTSFVDLFPTLLSLLGCDAGLEPLDGRNLSALFQRGERPGETSVVVEQFRVENGTEYQTALIDWPLKALYTDERRFELYDLGDDPLERSDRYPPRTREERDLVARLRKNLAHAGAPIR